jgi:hypothetical protein
LFEQTVNLEIEEAYSKLKTELLDRGCKIISEEPQKQICFKHGSLWGISPKTAKKTINLNFESVVGGTKVSCSSMLASDWKNITVIGCALAIVLVGLCIWMATDLSTLMVTRVPGFWSWLVMVGSNVNLVAAQAFINLTWGLAVFLSVIILLEVAIVIYVGSKIDLFAKNTLNQLN